MDTTESPNKYFNEIELKNVDNQLQLTVFGYTRITQKNSNLVNIIPKSISLIILALSINFSDEFDANLCDDILKLSNNNKSITG